jgi:hypothetical protein
MTVKEAIEVLKQMPSGMQVKLVFTGQSTPSSGSQFDSAYSPSGPYN